MPKKSKKLNLPKDTCSIRDMFEDIIYLFDSNLLTKTCVICRTDNTIATFANYFFNSISAPLTIFCEEIYISRCLHDYKKSKHQVTTYKMRKGIQRMMNKRMVGHSGVRFLVDDGILSSTQSKIPKSSPLHPFNYLYYKTWEKPYELSFQVCSSVLNEEVRSSPQDTS
nr:hypothetical protein Iba_chr14cCG5480 [Ipomoea batatas]